LLRYRNGKFIEALKIPGISDSYINAIAEDDNGDLWVGTNKNGVFKKKGNTNTFIHFTTRDGLADNYIISVSHDSKNNLWFSTGSGVSRYCNGEFKSFKKQDGLSGNNVAYTYEDKNHNIWILASKGINVLKNGQFSRDNMITYLQGIGVICIYEEDTSTNKGENVFWFGTYGSGLIRFKDGTFTSYAEKNGLKSNYIYQLFADDWGNFWMSSERGTLRISKSQLDAFAQGQVSQIHCTAFDTSDGMSSVHFYNALSGSSAIKTRDGELLFATKKGISMVHPGKIKINRIPPPVIIEDFFFKGSDQYSYNGLHSETIVFKGMNHIGFHFTSPTFLSSTKIKFKYKLEGHDKDWSFLAPGANRVALYEDLTPGTYVFKVTACSSNGIWNNSGDSMTFAITTCFQNSTSFKLLLLLGGLALVAAAVFLYKKYPLARNGKVKYNNSHLNQAYVKECIKKLDYSMEIEKIYRDENISLQSLSKKISITPHQLSRILNERLNKNFPDFINTYRVEEAKKILADPKQADRRILTIAFEVGFNTKVAFNKHTKMTPSQFRKKAIKSMR
jgi:ligand-binding sensor domain-containing protein/AraC-like DNA-binding protein